MFNWGTEIAIEACRADKWVFNINLLDFWVAMWGTRFYGRSQVLLIWHGESFRREWSLVRPSSDSSWLPTDLLVNRSPELKRQKAANFRCAKREVFRRGMWESQSSLSVQELCWTDCAVLPLNHRGKVVTWVVGKTKPDILNIDQKAPRL